MRTRTLLLPLAAATALLALLSMPSGALTTETPHEHHPDLCQFYPELETSGFVWTLANAYDGHGGAFRGTLGRGLGTAPPIPQLEFSIDANPDTPATPIDFDAAANWRLLLRVRADWDADLAPAPEPEDVRLDVTATIKLGHAPVYSQTATLVVQPGLQAADGSLQPWAATANLNPPSNYPRTVMWTFAPHGVPPGQEGTIDELNTEFSLGLADGGLPVDSPGNLNIYIELGADHSQGPPGAFLEVPGDCSGNGNGGGGGHQHDQGGHTHDADGGHSTPPSNWCDTTNPNCTPSQDEICAAVPGYCDPAAPPASDPAVPGDDADALAENAAPQHSGWGPTVVTAGLGTAGLVFFRPRHP